MAGDLAGRKAGGVIRAVQVPSPTVAASRLLIDLDKYESLFTTSVQKA